MVLKNTGNEVFEFAKQILEKRGSNVVLIPHENPDGDAIGSVIGLAEILKNSGQYVTVISPGNYPDFLKWFASEVEIVIYSSEKNRAKEILNNAEILFCLDFNEPQRAGYLEKQILKFGKTKILIDHHPNPSEFCTITVSEPTYSSTAEVVYDFIQNIGFKKYLSKNAAEGLYTGIMTDTGSFSHNISNPNTFKIVSELIKFGLNTNKIHSNVYHNFSADRMKLLGYCLYKKMEVFPEFRSAVINITKNELKEFGFKPGDTEGFVNYPLSINNIIFSALFIEKEDYIKASFRSKGNFPANEFSRKHFNGGGHLNAAGGDSKLNMEETLALFKQLLIDYKHLLEDAAF